MNNSWFIIGISGVTCGGKTTLANELNRILPNSRIISQDEYFLPVDDERHTWIPELNHINFDILTSLDMAKMYSDVKEIPTNSKSALISEGSIPNSHDHSKIIQKLTELQLNVLILEGFCILNYKPVESLCNLKFFLTLNKEECYKRRIQRIYEPPDCEGYFAQCVWPEYLNIFEYVKKNVTDVKYINEFTKDPVKDILSDLMTSLLKL